MSDWLKCFGKEPENCPDRVDVRYDNLGKHQNNNLHKTSVTWEGIKRWRPAATDATHPAAESPREVSDVQPDDAQTSPQASHSPARQPVPQHELFVAEAAEVSEVLDQYFDVQETLNARGARYGNFTDNAAVSQRIKDAMMYDEVMWAKLNYVQREALAMIAQKIARILNGDPNYKDNWHDIQGYARLAEERCRD